jgi:hypothetical protein
MPYGMGRADRFGRMSFRASKRRIGRAVHGDEDRALVANREVADDFKQRRQSAGGGVDFDEQVWELDAHRACRYANFGPNLQCG